ncbi:conserved hypothetical protein [uncultured Paludibacter sp.]|nr:conserved hypothetical protein [uncultured Paludibacter sp.]
MKVLGIVSVFYPDLSDLERNIKSYLSELDYLILWDNTPASATELTRLTEKLNNPKIEIRTTGKNEYLAYPFNECIKWAKENSFTHILTMDQDSFFEEKDFSRFISDVANNSDDNKIMIYTSCNDEKEKTINTNEIKFQEVELAITSGSIYKMEVFDKIGYFREDYLIYMIDIEFSMRVRKNGYKIVRFPHIILNHQSGYASKNNLGFLINNYSAQSTYYIIRNVILNWKLYPKNYSLKDKLKFLKYKIGYRTLKIVFETNPFLKLKAIYVALFHGLVGKSGEYEIR